MNATPPTLAALQAERHRLAVAPFALEAGLEPEQERERIREQQEARDVELRELDARIAIAERDAVEADPLAPPVRDRVQYLTRRLANATAAADLRDYAIALVACSEALEKLEDLDGRVHLDRDRVERWRESLRKLLELLGEPPDDEHARRPWSRAYYEVREGLLDDLHHAIRLAGQDAIEYEPAPLEPADVGIFGLIVELERRRDDAEPMLKRVHAQRDELERQLTAETERADEATARVRRLEAELAVRPEPSA